MSFDAARMASKTILIDAEYVDSKLKELASSEDLSRYVL